MMHASIFVILIEDTKPIEITEDFEEIMIQTSLNKAHKVELILQRYTKTETNAYR